MGERGTSAKLPGCWGFPPHRQCVFSRMSRCFGPRQTRSVRPVANHLCKPDRNDRKGLTHLPVHSFTVAAKIGQVALRNLIFIPVFSLAMGGFAAAQTTRPVAIESGRRPVLPASGTAFLECRDARWRRCGHQTAFPGAQSRAGENGSGGCGYGGGAGPVCVRRPRSLSERKAAKIVTGDTSVGTAQSLSRIETAEISVQGDTATVIYSDDRDAPFVLKRVDAQWRVPVNQLSKPLEPAELEQRLEDLTIQRNVVRLITQQIKAGAFANAEQAREAWQNRSSRPPRRSRRPFRRKSGRTE